MNQNWHYIFPKKLLLRAYSTLKHSLSSTKANYSSKMKISLCVLKGTLSARLPVTHSMLNIIMVHILQMHSKCLHIIIMTSGVRTFVSQCEILILKLRQ